MTEHVQFGKLPIGAKFTRPSVEDIWEKTANVDQEFEVPPGDE